jgi:hypothetical protein
MARSRIHDVKQDLVTDSGSVLWSIVRGEQLMLPAHLKFIYDVFEGFEFTAVLMEGDNIEGQRSTPARIRPGGVRTTLSVELPTITGEWDGFVTYSAGESVYYNEAFYTLSIGQHRINNVPPPEDPFWILDKPNKVLIQFPENLVDDWAVTPSPSSPVYGFFELSVKETGDSFPRIWKPVRGIVEVLYSP